MAIRESEKTAEEMIEALVGKVLAKKGMARVLEEEMEALVEKALEKKGVGGPLEDELEVVAEVGAHRAIEGKVQPWPHTSGAVCGRGRVWLAEQSQRSPAAGPLVSDAAPALQWPRRVARYDLPWRPPKAARAAGFSGCRAT